MKTFRVRLLTTIPGTAGKFWADNTTLVSDECRKIYISDKGRFQLNFQSLIIAIKLILKRKGFDVIIVDGGPVGQWFSWFQGLIPFRRTPTLMIDCLWYKHESRTYQNIKRALKRLTACGVDKFVVWARHEIEDYAAEFNIPKEKFVYIPFQTTLDDYKFEINDDGFVFAGGNGDRDYKTMLEAVRGLDIPVFIAAIDRKLFLRLDIPSNVAIKGLSHEEFRRKMATCRVAVVPMKGGLLHSGGQQTFLNSMVMGKPTIIVGPKAADGYVEHGKNGLVVDYGDVEGLRDAIMLLYNDGNLRREIGMAAHSTASRLTSDRFVRTIVSLAESLLLDNNPERRK